MPARQAPTPGRPSAREPCGAGVAAGRAAFWKTERQTAGLVAPWLRYPLPAQGVPSISWAQLDVASPTRNPHTGVLTSSAQMLSSASCSFEHVPHSPHCASGRQRWPCLTMPSLGSVRSEAGASLSGVPSVMQATSSGWADCSRRRSAVSPVSRVRDPSAE